MVWIGSSSSSLRKALSAHYNGNILSAGPFYIAVDIPAESLPDDLSSMLLERLLPRVLLYAVSESDAEDLAEKEYLTDAVSSDITENGVAAEFLQRLRDALRELLAESDRIHIEGLMYFRMKHDLSALYAAVNAGIRKHRSLYEKNRLLQLLHDHIIERGPQTPFLRITGNPSDYQLYDADGRTVRCIFPDDYTPEEHLLNSLLYLSPARIDLSALEHPELKSVLEEIFRDRLI